MNKTVLRLLVGTSALLLALALAACAPNGASTTTGSQTSSTTTSNAAATSSPVNTPTATSTTGATSSLPDGIPVYPGAKLSSSSAQNGVNTYLYTTSDTLAKVLDFYNQQMPANGWSKQQANGGVANELEFTKGQQRAVISAIVPLPTDGSALTTFSIAVSG